MLKKRRMLSFKALLAGLIFSISAGAGAAPRLYSPVQDEARLISADVRQELEHFIRNYRGAGGAQITVFTVKSLGGLSVEEYSIRLLDEWKLGGDKRDDGLLLLIAEREKKIRIEVGQGLEGDIPDAVAKRVIEDVMVPVIRSGDMSGAVAAAVFKLAQLASPEMDLTALLPRGEPHFSSPRKVSGWHTVFYIIILFFLLLTRTGRNLLLLMLLSRSGRRSSWGGMGSSSGWSGGRGWSGGGGGFSGGGASGGW